MNARGMYGCVLKYFGWMGILKRQGTLLASMGVVNVLRVLYIWTMHMGNILSGGDRWINVGRESSVNSLTTAL